MSASNSDETREQLGNFPSVETPRAADSALQQSGPGQVVPQTTPPDVVDVIAAPRPTPAVAPPTPPSIGSVANTATVSVNNYVAAPAIHLSLQQHRQPFVVRAIWFLLVGWWLSGIAILLAYALFVLVLTIPIGIWLLHRVPQLQTLRDRTREFQTNFENGQMVIREGTITQRPFWQRALWFIFVGWWLTAIWLSVAWVLSVLILTLPLSIAMIDRAPGILTLQKH